jgi:hypothetical protein
VPIGPEPEKVVVSPRHDYAITILPGSAAVQIRLLKERIADEGILAGVPPAPERIVMSPSGDTAGFYYRGERQLKVMTGLPDAPVLTRTITLPGDAGAIAISDQGGSILIAVQQADNGSLLFEAQPAGLAPAPVRGSVAAVAFRPDSVEAAVLTRSGELWLINAGHLLASGITAGGESALGFSRDGKRLFVTDATSRGVRIFHPAGVAEEFVSCDCTPTALVPMNAAAVFQLKEASQDRVLLVDAVSLRPRVVTVPFEYPAAQ